MRYHLAGYHPHTWVRVRGFTLIELMITVGIVAVLAAIAIPSYGAYVARTRRADARGQLVQVAQFMQRFYVANDNFSTDRAGNNVFDRVPVNLLRSPADGVPIYNLTVPAATLSPTSYEVRMVPVAAGVMGNDACGSFTLTSTGVRGVSVGGVAGTTSQRDTCWK